MHRVSAVLGVVALMLTPQLGSAQASSPAGATASAAPVATPMGVPSGDVKSPGIATVISVFVPGGGSMYAEHVGKGVGILGAFLASYAVMIDGAANLNDGETSAGAVLTLATWGYGLYAGYQDAQNYNRSLLRTAMRVQPLLQVGALSKTGHATHELGFSVRL